MKKSNNSDNLVVKNDWDILKKFTSARIGLGRTGVSLPTKEILSFALDHAQAQDAVYLPLDADILKSQNKNKELLELHSKVKDRAIYLKRPDLGRRLDSNSQELLSKVKNKHYDLSIVIVDGLSSLAVHKNAINFIKKITELLKKDKQEWNISPLCIVKQGRVAIGDEIGEILHAKIVLVLIGERPGLSSPDSLGLYMTFNPKVGLKDSSRNCISNIRSKGLSYENAANKALYLLKESRKLKLSGVELKERSSDEKTLTCKDI